MRNNIDIKVVGILLSVFWVSMSNASQDHVEKYKISWSTFGACGGQIVTDNYKDEHPDQEYFLSGTIGQPVAFQPEDDGQGSPYVIKSGFWHGVDKKWYGIFVNELASEGLRNGTDWANAYTSLQSALTEVRSYYADKTQAQPDIFVAAGTYIPGESRVDTFRLVDGIQMYGGFPAGGGAWIDRRPYEHRTVLSGEIQDDSNIENNSKHVVTCDEISDETLFEGFVVREGYADDNGGGMHLVNSFPIITNTGIEYNQAENAGGGIYAINSAPQIIQSQLMNNFSRKSSGGVIYVAGTEMGTKFLNCNIIGNKSYEIGAVASEENDGVTLKNTILWDNRYLDDIEYQQIDKIEGYTQTDNVVLDHCFIHEVDGYNPGFNLGEWVDNDNSQYSSNENLKNANYVTANYSPVLHSGSVCVDNGTYEDIHYILQKDWDNDWRISGENRKVDIGIDEYPSGNRRYLSDNLDGFGVISYYWLDSAYGNDWCQGADINNDGSVDTLDMVLAIENWLTKS